MIINLAFFGRIVSHEGRKKGRADACIDICSVTFELIVRSRILSLVILLAFQLSLFAQGNGAPRILQTEAFCKRHDLSTFLASTEQTGTLGIFDSTYSKLQMHFESIVRDSSNPKVYHITGASRTGGVVCHFIGEILISSVYQYDRAFYWALDTGFNFDPPGYDKFDKRYTVVAAQFSLVEDIHQPFSGSFSGKLDFELHENVTGELLNDLEEYMGDGYSNFVYNGYWESHHNPLRKICIWGIGKLPVPAGVNVGVSEFIVSQEFQKNGWSEINAPLNWWNLEIEKSDPQRTSISSADSTTLAASWNVYLKAILTKDTATLYNNAFRLIACNACVPFESWIPGVYGYYVPVDTFLNQVFRNYFGKELLRALKNNNFQSLHAQKFSNKNNDFPNLPTSEVIIYEVGYLTMEAEVGPGGYEGQAKFFRFIKQGKKFLFWGMLTMP